MSSTGTEAQHRLARLVDCFNACDRNHDGFVDREDLKALAIAFNPQAEVEKEAALVMSRLDKNKDDLISRDEWISFLNEIFQFMNLDAFDKHCNELFNTLSKVRSS